jgi:hypothetical protein
VGTVGRKFSFRCPFNSRLRALHFRSELTMMIRPFVSRGSHMRRDPFPSNLQEPVTGWLPD